MSGLGIFLGVSVLCGRPLAAGGICRRKVAVPGAGCGVSHAVVGAPVGPAGFVPAGAGPDPFAETSDGLDSQIRSLAADSQVCHHCGGPVEEDSSEGVFVHRADGGSSYDLDEDHGISPYTDIDETGSVMVKRWFTRRRPSHPDWYRYAALFSCEYDEWFVEVEQGGHPAGWSADPAELDVYADHPNWLVNKETAANPHTAASTLSRLAGHPNPDVRAAVAANPSASASVRAHAGLLAG